MVEHNSLPGLSSAICLHLSQWRNSLEFDLPTSTDPQIWELIHAQDAIGWDSLCFGSVHKSWASTQDNYLKSLGKKCKGTAWISLLIQQILELQRKMWRHRNSFVHKEGGSIHELELEAINHTLRMEFTLGRDGLSGEYASFFGGQWNNSWKN